MHRKRPDRVINGLVVTRGTEHIHAFQIDDAMRTAASDIIDKHRAMIEAQKAGSGTDAIDAESAYNIAVKALEKAGLEANKALKPENLAKQGTRPHQDAAIAAFKSNLNVVVFEAAREVRYESFPQPYGKAQSR